LIPSARLSKKKEEEGDESETGGVITSLFFFFLVRFRFVFGDPATHQPPRQVARLYKQAISIVTHIKYYNSVIAQEQTVTNNKMATSFIKRFFGSSAPVSNALKEAIIKETAANEVIQYYSSTIPCRRSPILNSFKH